MIVPVGLGLTLVSVCALYLKSHKRFAKLDRLNGRAIAEQRRVSSRLDKQESEVAALLELQKKSSERIVRDLSKLRRELQRESKENRDKVQRQSDSIRARLKTVDVSEPSVKSALLLDLMLRSTESALAEPGRSPRIIVSLTTIPNRLMEVSATIESLLHQTLKPDEIVLFLDESKVSQDDIPIEVQRQVSRGLRVEFCKDVGPHTKLIPALERYPQDIVITVDDDVLYPFFLVELLYTNHLKEPSKIMCTRARQMSFPRPRQFDYKVDWPNIESEREGLDVFPLGVGGVLYPPGSLDQEVFNLDKLSRLAPHADDIWFKTQSLRNNVICKRVTVRKAHFPLRPYSQESCLGDINVDGGKNEIQTKACFDEYGLWDLFPQHSVPEQPVRDAEEPVES